MAKWQVAVAEMSLTPGAPSDELAYERVVSASSRDEAIRKCIPGITKLWSRCQHPGATKMAVYCGKRKAASNAWRVEPAAIDREGNRVR